MIRETNDEMAWRLVWTSQWKLQQESGQIEPTLPKMIGHISVYNQVSEYMQSHNVSEPATSEIILDVDVGQVEDILLGNDDDDDAAADVVQEFSQLLSHAPKDSSPPTRPAPAAPSSVVVTAVEVDADNAGQDPFNDYEESSSHGDEEEDDDGWSSDEETEFGSVSSVEDEDEAGDDEADHYSAKLASIQEDDEGEADTAALLNGETT
jgi:hypothetical protein